MLNNKIAVIGDKDSVLAFKAVGADVFPVKNTFDAAETLKKLAKDYAVIFITEDIAEKISDVADRYKTRPYPAVIPIPGVCGSNGYGMSNISKNVEKAIGTDILNKK
jgi:V/A-type H+-transporting ATPase subunit F